MPDSFFVAGLDSGPKVLVVGDVDSIGNAFYAILPGDVLENGSGLFFADVAPCGRIFCELVVRKNGEFCHPKIQSQCLCQLSRLL